MITLAEFFKDLEYGELNQFNVSNRIDGDSGILEEDYPAIISHLNKALTSLHTQLPLKEREVTVNMIDEVSFYVLDSKYAMSNKESTEPWKYIADLDGYPFTDDIIKIHSVSDIDQCLPINDSGFCCNGVFIVNYNTIQVVEPSNDNALFITYRANHPRIEYVTGSDINEIEIHIPDYCIEPVLAYVASRMYARSSEPNAQNNSMQLMNKYTMLVEELKRQNVLHDGYGDETNRKGIMRGFV